MTNQLTLDERTVAGKKLKALRAAGQIPSVIYGNETPILAVSDYIPTEKALRIAGYHSPIELTIAGKKQLAIVKDVAFDPVSRRIINIEFQAVSADAEVEATTPIKLVDFDESPAAKLHLAVLQVLEDIEVKAKPSDLPSELTVDVSKLTSAEDKITIADLNLPKGVQLADKELESTTVIANVYDPAAEAAAREVEDAAETAETAETTTSAENAAEATSDTAA